jgi:nitroreductase
MEKRAETIYPIHEVLERRWSPRAFADRPIEAEKLRSLFEAARWTASSMNEQPWRFILACRTHKEDFENAAACLMPMNRAWAQNAPVLVFAIAKKAFSQNDRPNRVAIYDLGQAVANLSMQATSLGLSLHQMGGIEIEKVRSTYAIPAEFEPVTAIAIGYAGDHETLPEELRRREIAPRTRHPFEKFVFSHEWGAPSPLLNGKE